MRKTLLACWLSSIAASLSVAANEPTFAQATNFEPARPATATPASASPEAVQAAQEEVLRRQAAQVAGRALLDQGMRLYHDGNYDQAIVKLEQAVKTIPRARATEIDFNRALHALTDSHYRLGRAAFRAGDMARARDHAMKALGHDPRNRNAEVLLVNVRKVEVAGVPPRPDRDEARPDRTPEFKAKRDEVRRLFREGRILMNSGQHDEAEQRFQQVLLLDPYNDDAYALLDRVTALKMPSTEQGFETTRNQMLWQSGNAWLPPISGEVRAPTLAVDAGPMATRPTASAAILRKLNEIIFPEIRFREASITDVISFLSDESRRLDTPSHEGVNIVLGAGVTGEAFEPAPVEPGAAPAPPAGTRPITLSLRNVPMIEALKYITSLANLKYRIESNAVLILPADAPEGTMITRTYPVTPGAFSTIITGAGTAERRAGGEEFVRLGEGALPISHGTVDVKQLFSDAGVPFPAGSSIVYNDRTSTLIVKNTPENIEILERILPAFVDVPKQVEIEARFVEVSQNDLDELGFQWKVGQRTFGSFGAEGGSPGTIFPTGTPDPENSDTISGGLRNSASLSGSALEALLAGTGFGGLAAPNSVGTLRGILTNPQFELVISALAQKKSTDFLFAPKITTISGVQAQIKVVNEFIYPTEFSEPQVASGGDRVSIVSPTPGAPTTTATLPNITPSIPSAFRTREVGVVLNVTPTVGADGYTINLTLIPEVSEFVGFLDYSPGDIVAGESRIGFKIQQPLFSSRNLTTSIVIYDGQTVVLGGLIREDVQKIDDKIPFLGDIPIVGRLFRSKVSNRTKRNLLIFVTARLIDPAGNPIRRETQRTVLR